MSYINIYDLFAEPYITLFSFQFVLAGVFVLERDIYMTFLETEMKGLGSSTWNDTQHNIVDPYLLSISQMSYSRKAPSRWKSMNTHKHTTYKQLFAAVLKNFAIFTRIHLCWSLFLCFPINIAK